MLPATPTLHLAHLVTTGSLSAASVMGYTSAWVTGGTVTGVTGKPTAQPPDAGMGLSQGQGVLGFAAAGLYALS